MINDNNNIKKNINIINNYKFFNKNYIFYIVISFLAFIILTIIIFILYILYISKTLPIWNENNFANSMSSTIFDKNNKIIVEKSLKKNFKPVSYKEISPMFINAIIATEDSNFYKHKGYSLKGIFRSIFKNIFYRSKQQGGSTLTQQLARGVLLKSKEALSKNYNRKIKEILLALQIEERLTKEEIFTHYANNIYFGHGAYGIEAASITYFNKHSNELSDSEATLLAGLPQSPSYYDPYLRINEALKRREHVINRLLETKLINKTKSEKIKNTSIYLNDGTDYDKFNYKNNNNKYFIDYIILKTDQILHEKKLEDLNSNNYKIYTTLDTDVQSSIENTFKDDSLFPEKMNEEMPEGAMIVIDHSTGEIRGMVGGRKYVTEMGFNRAINAHRQPGSTFKPITSYGPAFESGLIAPSFICKDSPEPILFDSNNKKYDLINYSGKYNGYLSIRKAIAISVNTIPVRLLHALGTEKGFEFAKKLGIENLKNEEKKNLSIALGGLKEGVSPLEMARAYGVFANNGILIENTAIRKIENNYGKIIYEFKPKNKQVISPEVAYIITSTLKDVVNYGTGINAKIEGREIAGKTGTTDILDEKGNSLQEGNRDLWFAGYSPELTAVAWIGYDKSDKDHYLLKDYGSDMISKIWANAMNASLKNYRKKNFLIPKNIEELYIEPSTGFPTEINTGFKDIFIKGLMTNKLTNKLFNIFKYNKNTKNYSKKNNNNEIEIYWENKNNDYENYIIYKIDENKNKEKIGTTNSNFFIDTMASIRDNNDIEYIITNDNNDYEIKINYP